MTVLDIIKTFLGLAALYCAGMWVYLAAYSIGSRVDVETETFHLGLCFILAAGFLGLLMGA